MSKITTLIAGLGLMALLTGCPPIVQRVEPVRPARSSSEEWIARYKENYGCIGVARVNYGPQGTYSAEEQIEFDAKADYARICGIPGKLTLVQGLQVVRRTDPATGVVVGIAFKH